MARKRRPKQTSELRQSRTPHQYHCRGCGKPLSPSYSGLFHSDCLKADKRRRTREKRQLERERFEAWLSRQRCPECGAKLGQVRKERRRPDVEAPCEASQGPQSRQNVRQVGRGLN